jgi:cytochrome c oxidase assembly factor CtaG
MTTTQLNYFLWHAWDFDFSKIFGCLVFIAAFATWTKKIISLKFFGFTSGVILLFLSLASPLDALSDEYLFSAHMFQHFILLMVVPPILILNLPEENLRRLFQSKKIEMLEKMLSRPVFAWIFANAIFWTWHIPTLYDLAVKNESIHIFEHLCFLISATIFWWPVLNPIPEKRLPFAESMIYLVLGGFSNMVLGILLTFADTPFYKSYLAPEDSWKILPILHSKFHLDTLSDQRLGGILMWVLGSVVFLGIILIEIARWYSNEEEHTHEATS